MVKNIQLISTVAKIVERHDLLDYDHISPKLDYGKINDIPCSVSFHMQVFSWWSNWIGYRYPCICCYCILSIISLFRKMVLELNVRFLIKQAFYYHAFYKDNEWDEMTDVVVFDSNDPLKITRIRKKYLSDFKIPNLDT